MEVDQDTYAMASGTIWEFSIYCSVDKDVTVVILQFQIMATMFLFILSTSDVHFSVSTNRQTDWSRPD